MKANKIIQQKKAENSFAKMLKKEEKPLQIFILIFIFSLPFTKASLLKKADKRKLSRLKFIISREVKKSKKIL